MPLETIPFNGKNYPAFQAQGFASQFAFPFAMQVCKGVGFDIGCNRLEWALPESEEYARVVFPIDPSLKGKNGFSGLAGREIVNQVITGGPHHAMSLPLMNVDFVFSSHCLEHLQDWVTTLIYWHSKLKSGGILFLYLPDFSQAYWRPWANRKHVHCFTPKVFKKYIADQPGMWKNGFVSGVDLNNSFCVIAEKV
jgi:SAM-dependent methyltransferase